MAASHPDLHSQYSLSADGDSYSATPFASLAQHDAVPLAPAGLHQARLSLDLAMEAAQAIIHPANALPLQSPVNEADIAFLEQHLMALQHFSFADPPPAYVDEVAAFSDSHVGPLDEYADIRGWSASSDQLPAGLISPASMQIGAPLAHLKRPTLAQRRLSSQSLRRKSYNRLSDLYAEDDFDSSHDSAMSTPYSRRSRSSVSLDQDYDEPPSPIKRRRSPVHSLSRSPSKAQLHAAAMAVMAEGDAKHGADTKAVHRILKENGLDGQLAIETSKAQAGRATTAATSVLLADDAGKTKVYPCTWPGCHEIFKRREHVNRHMRKHTDERPYKCDIPGCTKTFSRSDNCAAHVRMHEKQLNQGLEGAFEPLRRPRPIRRRSSSTQTADDSPPSSLQTSPVTPTKTPYNISPAMQHPMQFMVAPGQQMQPVYQQVVPQLAYTTPVPPQLTSFVQHNGLQLMTAPPSQDWNDSSLYHQYRRQSMPVAQCNMPTYPFLLVDPASAPNSPYMSMPASFA